jgi:hypothetical protein
VGLFCVLLGFPSLIFVILGIHYRPVIQHFIGALFLSSTFIRHSSSYQPFLFFLSS